MILLPLSISTQIFFTMQIDHIKKLVFRVRRRPSVCTNDTHYICELFKAFFINAIYHRPDSAIGSSILHINFIKKRR